MKSAIIMAITLFSFVANADSIINVEQLNQVLKQKHANWVAKPTPVNEKSKDEVKRMLGLRRKSASDIQFKSNRAYTSADLPAVTDWRDRDGVNWVSPVLDQANCGSCVAFASVGTLETQYKIASGFSNFNVKFSPQYLFSCGGGMCDWGWQPEEAASFLQTNGVPDEACMPYSSGATGQDVACQKACSSSASRSVKIAGYATPSRAVADVGSVKQALQHGPLVTTLEVYADFMAYGGGVYKHVSGEVLGGHAVSIVGYDDEKQAYIIRNSWGEGWGEKGFGYVSYDDVSGVGDETWSYVMPSLAGAVSVGSPVDYSYYSGQVALKSRSTYPGSDSLSVTFFDQNGKAAWSGSCNGNSCDQAVDVSGLADGRYEVQSTAMDIHGQSLGQSTRQFFYVVNNKPTMTLSFVGKGSDLSKPLKGRMEVEITPSTSNNIPMSSVTFHYQGADGVDHTRDAFVVLPGMSMGWRTNLSANGTYQIWMTGHMKTNSFDQVVETPHVTVQTQN